MINESSPDLLNVIAPLLVGLAFIAVTSLLPEPGRRQFSALLIAGAGATYFGGGFGFWEVGFCALLTWMAFRALQDYRYVGAGWTLHIAWDLLHHFYGRPILPFLPWSSFGCAICDSVIALWYFLGAPSPYRHLRPAVRSGIG